MAQGSDGVDRIGSVDMHLFLANCDFLLCSLQ